jgi:predicted phage-related endonuclease
MAQLSVAQARRSIGLVNYMPGMFDRIHRCGSGDITASNVAALLGVGKYAGRYALAAHVSGRHPLPDADNARTRMGRWLEPVAATMLANETGLRVEPLKAYARCKRLPKLVASPDTLIWEEDGSIAIGELKLVHEQVFEREWLDGPPIHHQVQHQTQFGATGAKTGRIGALVWGISRGMELIAYPTEPNPKAIALIEREAKALLDQLAAGEMPEPDPHPSSIEALHALYPELAPGKVQLLDGEAAAEGAQLFDEWREIKARMSSDTNRSEEIRRWVAAKAGDAERLQIDALRQVDIKLIKRAGYTVPDTSYRTFKARDSREEAA